MARRTFHLTASERIVLTLYRTVSPTTRSVVGMMLRDAWTRPISKAERDEQDRRFKAAAKAFNLGTLKTSDLEGATTYKAPEVRNAQVTTSGARDAEAE